LARRSLNHATRASHSRQIREGGARLGFTLETLDGRKGVLAHRRLPGPPRVGAYGVDLAVPLPHLRAEDGRVEQPVQRLAAPGPATIAGRDASAPAADEPAAPIVDDIVLVDPVCGMTVDRKDARHLAEYGGVVYAFCQMVCRTRFIHDPAAFVAAASAPASSAPASVSSEPASPEA